MKKNLFTSKIRQAEIRRARLQIDYTEQHDDLINFHHFAALREKITTLLAQDPCCHLTILIVGIDNFRSINNLLGSDVGDDLLHKVAQRLVHLLGPHVVYTRKGNDEFIILIPEELSTTEISQIAKKTLRQLAQPFQFEDQLIYTTASMGISRYPLNASTTEELLSYADIALHQAKELGKNNYQFFTRKMGYETRYKNQIQRDLLNVIERDELFVCYQPQFQLPDLNIIGLEALLRWRNPTLGLVKPTDFIPLAEHTGLITLLGEWVLIEACMQAQAWLPLHPDLRMGVNVSAKQLGTPQIHDRHCIVTSVQQALKISNLPPQQLELEITESIIMHDDTTTKKNLHKLKDLGVRISCDDFGVGYASFSRLKQLPLDTIKIDKSLLKNILNNSVDLAIVRAIIAIAEQMKINVIAEGIESAEQVTLLQNLGCQCIQGHYASKPLLPASIYRLLCHLRKS